MNNIFSLILILSILLLIVKYTIDLKTDRNLVIILILIGLTCLSYILNYLINNPKYGLAGFIPGMIISPIIFTIHLLKKDKSNPRIRKLMIIPAIGILISYLSKSMHWQGAAVTNLVMLIPILTGIYLTFNKTQLRETKVMQIYLIFLMVDFMYFVIK